MTAPGQDPGKMNPSSAQIIARALVPGTHSVFFLGCFEERVTLYSQQIRALNLVDAILDDQEILGRDGRVAIVGGGAAGLTAAVAFAKAAPGLQAVDVYEKRSAVLDLQRKSPRHLHPHNYDWPSEAAADPVAGLPILNWRAGRACDVQHHLASEFDKIVRQSIIKLRSDSMVRNVHPYSRSQVRVDVEGAEAGENYDVVILSIGFGLERSIAGDTPSYWSHSTLEGPIHTPDAEVFISGNGDGGLVDFMTAALDGASHDEIFTLISGLDLGPAKAELELVEQEVWSPGAAVDIFQEYRTRVMDLVPPAAYAAVGKRLRSDVRVRFHTNEAQLFKRKTALINRFGCALILAADENLGRNQLSLIVGRDFVGDPPLTGEITIEGEAPFTPWRRFLRLGPDAARNIRPFEGLAAAFRSGATKPAVEPRAATPVLTAGASARFGVFVSSPGPETLDTSGVDAPNGRGANFVLDPKPGSLPAGLRRTTPFRYREAELSKLEAMFNNPRQDVALAILWGETLSGKSALMWGFAASLAERNDTPNTLAMLYVDLASANWPLRALFLSVRGPDQLDGAMLAANSSDGHDELDELETKAAEFISSYIPHHLKGRRLVCFLEKFQTIASKEASVQQVRSILESGAFRTAFTVLENHSPTIPTPSLVPTPMRLGALKPALAIEFLVSSGIGRVPAEEAVAQITGEDILFPGILAGAAATFVGDPDPVAPSDIALALIRTTSEIAWDTVDRVCKAEGLPLGPVMLSLMAISAFEGVGVHRDMLERIGFHPVPWQGLLRVEWVRVADVISLEGFGQDAVRAAATMVLGRGDRHSLTPAEELIKAIERLSVELFSAAQIRASPVLDGTVAWLRQHAPMASVLRLRLEAILEQDAVSDPVSPLPPEEERKAAPEFLQHGRDGDLDAGLAALLLYARAPYDPEVPEGVQKAAFLDSLEAAATLVNDWGRLNTRQLGALDTALFVGSRRFHVFAEVHRAREAMLETLKPQEPEAIEGADGKWLAVWLSFLLGAADGALGLRQVEAARTLTDRAIGIMEGTESWWQADSWKHWIKARAALLLERLVPGAAEKKSILLDAVAHGAKCVSLAPANQRCIRFYLRLVSRLVRAESDDAARKDYVDGVRTHLERLFGLPDQWSVSVRAQFAALMRDEARRAWAQSYQQTRAREALDLLRTDQEEGRAAVENDPRAGLVQARLQAFLGDRPGAVKSCNRSIELSPTAAAWALRLRLLDGMNGGARDWSGEPVELIAATASGISPDLRAAIKDLVDWTRTERAWTRSYGKVLLWVTRRKWRSEGSIERWVARQEDKRGNIYKNLHSDKKVKLLTPVFNQRESQLMALQKRFGESIPITLARFENRAQFTRSISVVTGQDANCEDALGVIDAGLKIWPGSPALQLAKAEYQRYIWHFDAAIDGFRSVLETATNGDLRRQAAAALARTLHMVATHSEDDDARKALLTEARSLLDNVGGSEDRESTAILRDHIAFELGEEVDWTFLEEVYDQVVGKIDGFPNTLLGEFDELHSRSQAAPASLADVLRVNFADSDVLGLAGLLYLRRAEMSAGNNRPEDFRRAIAFFRAEALIERSWEGIERAVTSFRNARTILSAAKAFESVNPIEGLTTEGKADQLAFAAAKFNSSATRTTGDFRTQARHHQSVATRLGERLRADPEV